MRVVLAGGGTGGSVTPLLAIAAELRATLPDAEFLFAGGKRGPEQILVAAQKIPFVSIMAGKLRRYFSFQNFIDLFRVMIGFFQSFFLLGKFQPDIVVSVGSFVAVPVVWAAWIRGIPSLIHQQDIVPSLSNKLGAPFAKKITVSFEQSLRHFPQKKTLWVGNPIRRELLQGNAHHAGERFGLRNDLPVVLAFGGGTGAMHLNQIVAEAGLNLVQRCQILLLTGSREHGFRVEHPNFHTYEFLTDEMADAYAVADIVVCRAGLSTLSEIAALGKPTIVIPLPGTHQEENAKYFERNHAAVVLYEHTLRRDLLEQAIVNLLNNSDARSTLSRNVRKLTRLDAGARLVREIVEIAHLPEINRIERALSGRADRLLRNEPLGPHTNFRLGGPADLFVICRSRRSVIATFLYLHQQNIPYCILGGGANVVCSDLGFRGVVVQVKNEEFSVQGDEVVVGAGMNTGQVASRCLQAGLVGMEFIVGIYGTIGGAVRGNAGSFGTEMRDVVVACEVITPQETVETWTNEQLKFGYRHSVLKTIQAVVVTVRLRLRPGDVKQARQKIVEYSGYKRRHQPLHYPSAGCIFKNYELQPRDEKLRQRFSSVIKGDRIPAWALLAEAGCAGLRVGDIQVSDQHANFFLNLGKGKAEDVVILASMVKHKVRDLFGVQLHEEVQFLGFS